MNEPNNGVDPGKRRRRSSRTRGSNSGARSRTIAASAILTVWGASALWDIYSQVYDPPEGINTVALAAATYLFGSAFFKDRGGDS